MQKQVKYLEIRDRMTCINVLAYKMCGDEHMIVAKAGFSTCYPYCVVTRLDNFETSYDTTKWLGSRTMQVAHNFIHQSFDDLIDGDVVDVEFILDETDEPKRAEWESYTYDDIPY